MAEALRQSDSDFSDDELSPLEKTFNEAADHLRKITGMLNNDQLLNLYGLFKQGTEGNCNTPRPGWLDGRGRKKWDSWNSNKGMTKEGAQTKYISLVQELDPSLSLERDNFPKENWIAVSSLRKSSEPDIDVNEMTVLEAARENCSKRLAELLIQNPLLKNEKDDDGLTILHWAADRDAIECLTVALSNGCNLEAIDESGQTPLHYAASCGHVNATKILLEAGASVTVQDSEGNTAKDLASDEEIRKLLVHK